MSMLGCLQPIEVTPQDTLKYIHSGSEEGVMSLQSVVALPSGRIGGPFPITDGRTSI